MGIFSSIIVYIINFVFRYSSFPFFIEIKLIILLKIETYYIAENRLTTRFFQDYTKE
jgi:hypothetical protein